MSLFEDPVKNKIRGKVWQHHADKVISAAKLASRTELLSTHTLSTTVKPTFFNSAKG